MLDKLVKMIFRKMLGGGHRPHNYKRYSSSDYKKYGHNKYGHSKYGHKHYKKKFSSFSIFSS